jgi:hypothetical protein
LPFLIVIPHQKHQNEDKLSTDDILVFHFRHCAFDGISTSIFLQEFSLAYHDQLLVIVDDTLQYIDYFPLMNINLIWHHHVNSAGHLNCKDIISDMDSFYQLIDIIPLISLSEMWKSVCDCVR